MTLLPGAADWRPSTEAEEAMVAAVAAKDEVAYCKALSEQALYLPISPAAAAGREPVVFATSPAGGVTYVLAWTSGTSLPPEIPYLRRSPLFEIVHAIRERGWGIAVDPGMPLQAFLSPEAVRTLPPWEPEWWPLDDTLRRAVLAEDRDAYVRALLDALLILPLPTEQELAEADPQPDPDDPEAAYWTVVRTDRIVASLSRDVSDPEFPWWRTELLDGREVVLAFTSVAHMQAELGDREWVAVPFLEIVVAWPDASPERPGQDRPALRLNPGAGNGMELPAEALAEMLRLFQAARRANYRSLDDDR